MKKTWLPIAAGSVLILSGVILFCLPAAIRHYQAPANSVPPVEISVTKEILPPQAVSGRPSRLTIPALSLDLPVIDGTYNSAKQTWTLTDTNVQFATMTNEPNNVAGLTFMYGHATKRIFGKLPQLRAGDEVKVEAANGKVFTYKLVGSQTVTPEAPGFLQYQGKPTLVLQTCSGLFSQNRTLYTFDFVEVA